MSKSQGRKKKCESSSSPVAATLPEESQDESLRGWMERKFASLEERVATKDCIANLLKIIEEQKTKISQLEDKVGILERHVLYLEKSNDDGEQYQRRLCLRINGIDLPSSGESESADECLHKVQKVFDEIGVDVPDTVIDRAHRIGKLATIKGKRVKQMIVRFTTWRYRSMVYKARKQTSKYRIKLDLTRKRRDLIKKANESLVSENESFVFADINCNVCWLRKGEFLYFNDLQEFEKLRDCDS